MGLNNLQKVSVQVNLMFSLVEAFAVLILVGERTSIPRDSDV